MNKFFSNTREHNARMLRSVGRLGFVLLFVSMICWPLAAYSQSKRQESINALTKFEAYPEEGGTMVSVYGPNERPVTNVRFRIQKFYDYRQPDKNPSKFPLFKRNKNPNGRIFFKKLPDERGLYLIIEAPRFNRRVIPFYELKKKKAHFVYLSYADNLRIAVKNEDGHPIEEAFVSDIVEVGKTSNYHLRNREGKDLLMTELPFKTDHTGKSWTPALRRGGLFDITVMHKDYTPVTIRNVKPNSETRLSFKMTEKVAVTINIVGTDGKHLKLKERAAFFKVWYEGSNKEITSYGDFYEYVPAEGKPSKVLFPARKLQCIKLHLWGGYRVANCFVSENFNEKVPSNAKKRNLDLTNKGAEFTFVLEKMEHPSNQPKGNATVTGTAKRQDGKVLANTWILVSKERDIWSNGKKYFERIGSTKTDQNGRYEVRVPNGKIKIHFSQTSNYYDCDEEIFNVSDQTSSYMKNLTAKAAIVKGIVVDENEKPLAGALVTIPKKYGKQEFVRCAEDGSFSWNFKSHYAWRKSEGQWFAYSKDGVKAGKLKFQDAAKDLSKPVKIVCLKQAPFSVKEQYLLKEQFPGFEEGLEKYLARKQAETAERLFKLLLNSKVFGSDQTLDDFQEQVFVFHFVLGRHWREVQPLVKAIDVKLRNESVRQFGFHLPYFDLKNDIRGFKFSKPVLVLPEKARDMFPGRQYNQTYKMTIVAIRKKTGGFDLKMFRGPGVVPFVAEEFGLDP